MPLTHINLAVCASLLSATPLNAQNSAPVLQTQPSAHPVPDSPNGFICAFVAFIVIYAGAHLVFHLRKKVQASAEPKAPPDPKRPFETMPPLRLALSIVTLGSAFFASGFYITGPVYQAIIISGRAGISAYRNKTVWLTSVRPPRLSDGQLIPAGESFVAAMISSIPTMVIVFTLFFIITRLHQRFPPSDAEKPMPK